MIIKKYPVQNPILKTLITGFWVTDALSPITINHKLLPVNSIDLILNFSAPIQYTSKHQQVTAKGFHFSGLRNTYCQVQQSGKLNMIGISFKSFGLYPLVKIPISAFTNQIIDLSLLNKHVGEKLADCIANQTSTAEKIATIEEALLKYIDLDLLLDNATLALLNKFTLTDNHISIDHFCAEHGIHKRRLERIFSKYIGLCPKTYAKLERFRKILNALVSNNYRDLTTLSYAFNYYDQTHFGKDFKAYTGNSPLDFLRKKTSVKQIITFV